MQGFKQIISRVLKLHHWSVEQWRRLLLGSQPEKYVFVFLERVGVLRSALDTNVCAALDWQGARAHPQSIQAIPRPGGAGWRQHIHGGSATPTTVMRPPSPPPSAIRLLVNSGFFNCISTCSATKLVSMWMFCLGQQTLSRKQFTNKRGRRWMACQRAGSMRCNILCCCNPVLSTAGCTG